MSVWDGTITAEFKSRAQLVRAQILGCLVAFTCFGVLRPVVGRETYTIAMD